MNARQKAKKYKRDLDDMMVKWPEVAEELIETRAQNIPLRAKVQRLEGELIKSRDDLCRSQQECLRYYRGMVEFKALAPGRVDTMRKDTLPDEPPPDPFEGKSEEEIELMLQGWQEVEDDERIARIEDDVRARQNGEIQ